MLNKGGVLFGWNLTEISLMENISPLSRVREIRLSFPGEFSRWLINNTRLLIKTSFSRGREFTSRIILKINSKPDITESPEYIMLGYGYFSFFWAQFLSRSEEKTLNVLDVFWWWEQVTTDKLQTVVSPGQHLSPLLECCPWQDERETPPVMIMFQIP